MFTAARKSFVQKLRHHLLASNDANYSCATKYGYQRNPQRIPRIVGMTLLFAVLTKNDSFRSYSTFDYLRAHNLNINTDTYTTIIAIKWYICSMINPRRACAERVTVVKNGGGSLLIEGSITSDPSIVLPHWADHFTSLSQSRCPDNPNLQMFSVSIHKLELQTYSDEELILDTPFSPEEVSAAIYKASKARQLGGP